MPTPSSRMPSASSNTSQWMPRARNISAVVRPPIPPPTIITFIAFNSTQNWGCLNAPLTSHSPLFRGKRLCRLRFQFRPGLRLSLNFQVLEILPVAHAVAENLFLSGQILRRTRHAFCSIPGSRLHRERRIDQMRAAECHEVSPAGGQDGVDLVRRRDVADAHGGHAGLVANLIGKRRLE